MTTKNYHYNPRDKPFFFGGGPVSLPNCTAATDDDICAEASVSRVIAEINFYRFLTTTTGSWQCQSLKEFSTPTRNGRRDHGGGGV